MATTQITVQDVVRTGLEATYSAAASGDGNVFDNSQKNTFVHIKNAGGSDCTITIHTPAVVDTDLAVADRTVVCTAGEERFIGPFSTPYEGNDADNSIDRAVKLTYDQVTSVTIAALRIP